MTISNSKKQLAKIISENGGWREGEFAAQDKDGDVFKFDSKPVMGASREVWMPTGNGTYKLCCCATIKGWHQTILSREEYFHLYPAPDADGWIEYDGKGSPYSNDVVVEARWTDGDFTCSDNFGPGPAWIVDKNAPNITHHRLHNPEQSKPEFCESVMRSIPEPSDKPTIEQLAADYRNAKDYAERKQEEADAAKVEEDAKLAALVAAGKEFGLVLSVAAPEPELVITDWRDLQEGDLIIAVRVEAVERLEGCECIVVKTQDNGRNANVLARFGNERQTWWVKEWRFIRRP